MDEKDAVHVPVAYRLFDYFRDAVIVTDYDWHVRYVNRLAAKWFQRAEGDNLLQRSLPDLPCLQRYPQLFLQAKDSLAESEPWQADEVWVGPDDIRTSVTIESLDRYFADDTNVLWRFVNAIEHHRDAMPWEETAEVYRNLVELASDGVCIVKNGVVQFANPQLAGMLGMEADELIGTTVAQHIAPEHLKPLDQLYHRHLQGGRNLGIAESVLLHRDGHRIDVEIDAAIIPYHNVPCTLVTLHDVSGRKSAEKKIRTSEQRYRLITESSMDIIWAYDPNDQRFVYASHAMERLLGFSQKQLAHVTLKDIFPPESLRKVTSAFERLLTHPQERGVVLEIVHRRQDGSPIWMEVNGSPVTDEDRQIILISGVSRDITERREAERALRESEQRNRQLVDVSPNLIAISREGEILFINPAGRQMFLAGDEPVKGRTFWEFVHPDDIPGVRQRLRDVMQKQLAPPTVEIRCRRLDGSELFLEVTSVAFRYRGRPSILTVGQDISERKKAENALRYRLELLQLITAIATEFIHLGPDQVAGGIEEALAMLGRFIDVDRCYFYVYDQEEIFPQGMFEWLNPEGEGNTESWQDIDFSQFPWWTERMRNLAVVHFADAADLPEAAAEETDFFAAQKVQSSLAVPMISHSENLAFLGLHRCREKKAFSEEILALLRTTGFIFTSALERQRVDMALRESEGTARTLIEATQAIAFLVDRSNRVLAVNQLFSEAFGRRKSVVGAELFSLLPQDLQVMAREVKQTLFTEKKPINRQEQYRGRWYLLTVNPVLDDQGEVTRTAVYARDITDIKAQEEELREALRKAREAELLKSRFLANMSHEIRTPLNHVIGLTSILLMQPDTPETERQGYLKIIKRGGQSMLRLMTAILDLSKIESGKVEPAKLAFDFGEWCQDLCERFRLQVEAKQLQFHSGLDANLPRYLFGDPVVLEQILGNLVDNAIKFTNQGSIELCIRHLAVDKSHHELEFVVADTGIGIAPDNIERVFGSFFQVDDSSTREYQGAGLGLTISQELAKQLGTEIMVESEPDKGSRFWFSLRMMVADVAQVKAEEDLQAGFESN